MCTDTSIVVTATATIFAAFGGAALGAFFAYQSGIKLIQKNHIKEAGAKLRAAFAPELAKIRLDSSGKESFDIKDMFTSALPRHAAAIEEFSFYIPDKDKDKYYKAWENYSATYIAYVLGPTQYKDFFDRVHAILQFTE